MLFAVGNDLISALVITTLDRQVVIGEALPFALASVLAILDRKTVRIGLARVSALLVHENTF